MPGELYQNEEDTFVCNTVICGTVQGFDYAWYTNHLNLWSFCSMYSISRLLLGVSCAKVLLAKVLVRFVAYSHFSSLADPHCNIQQSTIARLGKAGLALMHPFLQSNA